MLKKPNHFDLIDLEIDHHPYISQKFSQIEWWAYHRLTEEQRYFMYLLHGPLWIRYRPKDFFDHQELQSTLWAAKRCRKMIYLVAPYEWLQKVAESGEKFNFGYFIRQPGPSTEYLIKEVHCIIEGNEYIFRRSS